MSDRLLSLYHLLPPPARSLAAGVRGLYLRSWRYGPDSEKLVAEVLDRDSWSTEQWNRWREERLAYLLDRAATRVPYYREYWNQRRRKGDRASWEELGNWPLLSKESLRENPRAFIADDRDPKRMFPEHTSGTSGKPLDLWWSRETVRSWYALFEARARRWHDVSRNQPWAILGGQPVAPAGARKPPFWVWNAPMRQLYLSANHISRQNAPFYLEALEKYGITHFITYSSSAARLAQELADQNLRVSGLKVVITNAEPLFPRQREAIREGFGCEARETYGMAEIAAAAGECPHGNLHLWPEAGHIEVLRDDSDQSAPTGEPGRLIATGLLNTDMPLIRYETGDRIRPRSEPGECSCGRRLPLIEGIEGRTNDMLLTPDGRHVFWLNPVFYGLPVREAQIIQESLELICVRCIPASGYNQQTENMIRDRLRARIGDVQIAINAVDEIPRGPNGKFHAVISKLNEREKRNKRK